MFQPFVRGQHHSVPGFGLGLATVKRLIEAHGGTVGVKSTTGHGAVFWIELPLARRVVQTYDARSRTRRTSGL
jgi:two-component system, OmpR family, sensor kinase